MGALLHGFHPPRSALFPEGEPEAE